MLVSLLSGVWETFKKLGVIAVLSNSSYDIAPGYMGNYHSREVERPLCTSSRFPYDFSMGEVSDAPLRSAF